MKNFMNYDFNITNINIAMYVKPQTGASVHKNRSSHGIAINLCEDAEGKKYIFSDGKTILVEKNDIVYMPKGSSYTVHSKTSGNCYAINFDIDENIDFAPFSFTANNTFAFINEFKLAAELWSNKKTAFHMQCKSTLYKILSLMQSEYNKKYITQSTVALIMPAVEYIHKNYSKEYIYISELSAKCRISEDYFRKIFKNVYGISPLKYINNLKLSYSKELINSGMYTLTEVAELSGYTDISYFSKEFKKAYCIWPSEYAKNNNIQMPCD